VSRKVYCVATVVLRKQLNFKIAVIRSKGSSCQIVFRSKILTYSHSLPGKMTQDS